MSARIDHTVTSGTFSLDGQTYDVDNNVWVVGDDEECLVIDAPHDIEAILGVVGTRDPLVLLADDDAVLDRRAHGRPSLTRSRTPAKRSSSRGPSGIGPTIERARIQSSHG